MYNITPQHTNLKFAQIFCV